MFTNAQEQNSAGNRLLPIIYFAAGHLVLVAALVLVALRPEAIAGFFLHPRLAAVVHAITLGWLTTSILGALYVIWPVALGQPLRVGKLDYAACVLVLLGSLGVIAHLWIDGYHSVGLSGLALCLAAVPLVIRFLVALRTARGPTEVRLHIALALANLLLTLTLGILAAFHKRDPSLISVNDIDLALGHLHLGLLGWVGMMILGAGYRLIPMFLPAHPVKGPRVWATAVLLETGALGLAASHIWHKSTAPLFGGIAALGLLLFLLNILSMARQRVPAPPKARRPDLGMLHAIQALLYLALCLPLGLWLVWSSEWPLNWVMVYGVFALLGFPAQFVIGIAMRLFPMFAWKEAWHASGFKQLPTSPHEMPTRPLQWLVLATWTPGVPMLAYGLAAGRQGWISLAAGLLALGAVAAATNSVRVLRHAFAHQGKGVPS